MSCAKVSEAHPSPAPSVALSSSLCELNEDDALAVLAEALNTLDTEGISLLRTPSRASAWLSPSWPAALATLAATAPLNSMAADALLGRVSAAFTAELRTFQAIITQTSGRLSLELALPALQRLGEVFWAVRVALHQWCTALRVPGISSLFAVRVRCALLQDDLITGEEPLGKRTLLSFLRREGRSALAAQSMQDGSAEEVSAVDGAGTGSPADARVKQEGALLPLRAMHPLIATLDRLTLSQSVEIRQLWRTLLEDSIDRRLSSLSDDFSSCFLHAHIAWVEHTVVPFVHMVLCDEVLPDMDAGDRGDDDDATIHGAAAARASFPCRDSSGVHSAKTEPAGSTPLRLYPSERVRAERDSWCTDLRLRLLRSYARRRLEHFWAILSDYPDSTPALEDMHHCLQSNPESDLKSELVQTVRHLLSSRLDRAGTRTEDILAILVNTIHAFCILFPRNEQNRVVFSVISDTLEHLRRRKDRVTALVQFVMQAGGLMHFAPAPPTQTLPSGNLGADVEGAFGGCDGEIHPAAAAAARDRPDVLRVLLTSIHKRALVQEYQQMLAGLFLTKPMHEFDTTKEEEVLERLRQVFGESVLDRCTVMVRDMQVSRRISQQLREQVEGHRSVDRTPRPLPLWPQGTSSSPATAPPPFSSVSVLSMTAWPPPASCAVVSGSGDPHPSAGPSLSYCPHPKLQAQMDALAAAYKRLKDNQRLMWLTSLGRVELELLQRDPSKGDALVPVAQVLSLFDASLVLYVKDLTGSDAGKRGGDRADNAYVPLQEVAASMKFPLEELRQHAQRLPPTVVVYLPSMDVVGLQRSVASSADFVFAEDRSEEESNAAPVGLPPERVKLLERMVTSLLKTRGPQPSTAIHSSLKLLAKFEGSMADVQQLLLSFVARSVIVMNESRLFALPPK